MNKELQDLAWAVLPKEFKEEVKKEWRRAYYNDTKVILEYFFGKHNLTFDAEREEILTVSRKKVQEEYRESINKANPYNINSYNRGFHVGCGTMLKELFGSKCLPDELANEDNFATKEPKPAEPKFKVGDIAVVRGFKHPLLESDGAIVTILSYCAKGDFYSCAIAPNVGIDIDTKYLEPYTEQREDLIPPNSGELESQEADNQSRNLSQKTANCDKEFDTILKGGFRDHNRLQIAAMAMQGLMCNPYGFTLDGEDQDKTPESIAEMAFLFADALIARAEKGDDE